MAEEYAGMVAEVRDIVETYLTPEIGELTEPETGVVAAAVIDRNGVRALDDAIFDQYRTKPKRRKGTASFTQLASLIDHINRFKDDDSALFAWDNRIQPTLSAVLNYHEAGNTPDGGKLPAPSPRFGDHRSHYCFPLSDEWKAWIEGNGVPMKMANFARFLEDRIIDVIDLDPADDTVPEDLKKFITICGGTVASPAKLVELSRGLQVYESAIVAEAVNLSSGEGQISFQVEHKDQYGGKLKVPGLFLVAIPVFKNGEPYRLAARLRYRKTGEGVVFSYELWRSDRAFDTAFKETCEDVRDKTGLPLFYGLPE